NQHFVREVAGQHGMPLRQRKRQIAGAAADIEHARIGPVENVPQFPHRPRAPVAIDVVGEQVIRQIVAMRDAVEHAAHPTRGLLLIARPHGRRAAHESADRMASSTGFSSMPETTVTSPMRTGRMKCTLPCTVFLSCTRRAARFSAGMPVTGGIGPYAWIR